MSSEPSNAPLLPRIFIISSGTEKAEAATPLLQQLALIPDHIPCMVQLREKALNNHQLQHLATLVKPITRGKKLRIVVNESFEIADNVGLDGVHLPEKCPLTLALRKSAPNMLLGCSTHSLESALRAADNGADYVTFSPIFDTASKRHYGAPQGLKALEMVCAALPIPVYALGGISLERVTLCRDYGAYGIAAISLFQPLEQLPTTLEQCYNQLEA